MGLTRNSGAHYVEAIDRRPRAKFDDQSEQAMEEIYKQNLLRWPHKDRPTVDSLETRVSALEADLEELRQVLSRILPILEELETWIGD